jgi:hypothetical protein
MTEEQRLEMAGSIIANRTLIIMLMRLLVLRGVLSQTDLQDALIEAIHSVDALQSEDPQARRWAQIELQVTAEVFDPSEFRPEDE